MRPGIDQLKVCLRRPLSSFIVALFILHVSVLPIALRTRSRQVQGTVLPPDFGPVSVEKGQTSAMPVSIDPIVGSGVLPLQKPSADLTSRRFVHPDSGSPNLDLVTLISWPQKSVDWGSGQNSPRFGGENYLEVRPAGQGQSPVRKKSRSILPNSDVTEDRRQAAARALVEAEQLRNQWTFESFRKAIEKYHQALLKWHAIGDLTQEAAALENI